MNTDTAGQRLHDRATRGEPLSAAERAQLDAWYARLDAEEGAALAGAARPDCVTALQGERHTTAEGSMNAIKGIYKNGQVVLDRPADWPDGTPVVVEPVNGAAEPGASGDEQADDPESVARWTAAFDAIPPLQMTPQEEAEWRAARQAQKVFELATWEERAKRLERLCE